MAAFVLDASVAISWCFPGDPTEDTPYSRRVLSELAVNDAIVPEIWAFEIANSIFVAYRKRKESPSSRFTNTWSFLRRCPSASKRKACGPMWIWSLWLAAITLRPMMSPIWIWRGVRILSSPLRMGLLGRRRLLRVLQCLAEGQRSRAGPSRRRGTGDQ